MRPWEGCSQGQPASRHWPTKEVRSDAFVFVFFNVYLERERERKQRRGRERERGRIPNGLLTASVEPDVGLKLTNSDLSRSQESDA